MTYYAKLSGPDLASALADTLTDLEFELLVRNRVRALFSSAHAANANLDERYDCVTFRYDGLDKSTWCVMLGEVYSKRADTTGEVLRATFSDAINIMHAKDNNKLSVLLGFDDKTNGVASNHDDPAITL